MRILPSVNFILDITREIWYSNNMNNKLQELIELCPCAVAFGNAGGYDGGYCTSTNTITIEDKLNEHQRFSVLAHELQHAECQRTNCVCRKHKVGGFLREYHAYKSQIVRCLGNIPALKASTGAIRFGADDSVIFSSLPGHIKACKRLVKTKLWRKALKLCGFPLQ